MKNDEPLDEVRAAIVQRAANMNLSLKTISALLGKNQAYIWQFIHRKSPENLPDRIAYKLAEILHVPPQSLTAEPLFVPLPRDSSAPPLLPSASGHGEIPVYQDTDKIDRAHATQWAPHPAPGAGVEASFGVWITEPRGRLAAGDLAFVKEQQPPRIGDMVLVLCDKSITHIGSLLKTDHDFAYLQTDSGETRVEKARHRLLKITSVQFC